MNLLTTLIAVGSFFYIIGKLELYKERLDNLEFSLEHFKKAMISDLTQKVIEQVSINIQTNTPTEWIEQIVKEEITSVVRQELAREDG